MAFTNSFHSSAKSHAISSASALAGVEAHNERDFFSLRYSADKTHFIVGTAGLSDTVKDFINETFGPHIDAYNEKQRRKDRRITTDAFDYFCGNKNLDIAAEAIFQIADQDFWSRWRTDTVIQHLGKEIVRSEYPEHIAAVMDEIYRRQIDAYEHIYETHSAEILAKIETHYNRCQDTLDAFRANPELYERFEKLAEMKAKPRKKALKELSADELEAYDTFQNAYYGAQDIERKQYRERIAAGQLHIKMLQALGHYDEKSPHAHGVSVCWADGYKSGLPSRLAKAVVLNRYALEVIQDRLHEIAQEEIAKYPEIFGQEKLQEKGAGRNMDYTTEQHIRQMNRELKEKNQQLQKDTRELRLERSRLSGDVGLLEIRKADIDGTIKAAEAIASELQQQNTALASEMEEICRIKTIADYDSQLEENQDVLNMLSNTLGQVRRTARTEGVSPDGITRILRAALDAMTNFIRQLEANIAGMKIFEWLNAKFFGDGDGQRKPVAQEQQRRLDSILENAGRRSEEIKKNNQEKLENGVTIEPAHDIKG